VGDPVSSVGGDVGQQGGAFGSKSIEERFECRSVSTGCGPDQPAAVVTDDHRDVAVALLVADLIDPDPSQPLEPIDGGVDVSDHAGDDRPDRAPRDPHQPGHGRLRGLHGQPGDLIVEEAGVTGVMASPRHRRDQHSMLPTRDSGRVRLELRDHRPEIKGSPPPPALTPVIDRAPPAALRTAPALTLMRLHMHDQDPAVLVVLDPPHRGLLDSEQPSP